MWHLGSVQNLAIGVNTILLFLRLCLLCFLFFLSGVLGPFLFHPGPQIDDGLHPVDHGQLAELVPGLALRVLRNESILFNSEG